MQSNNSNLVTVNGSRSTTKPELQIRRLTAADLPAVQAIHSSIPLSDRSEAWDTFSSWYAAACQMGTFGTDWEGSVLAEWDSKPAGFLLMHRESRAGNVPPGERIMVAAVDPVYWRKGIGREMAKAAIELSKQRGVRVVQSIVPERHPGHSKFLEHCGFSRVPGRHNRNGVRIFEMLVDQESA